MTNFEFAVDILLNHQNLEEAFSKTENPEAAREAFHSVTSVRQSPTWIKFYCIKHSKPEELDMPCISDGNKYFILINQQEIDKTFPYFDGVSGRLAGRKRYAVVKYSPVRWYQDYKLQVVEFSQFSE